MGVAHLGGEERVGGVLVLVPPRHLRDDPELCQGVLDEDCLRDDPGEADLAGRLDPDLLEGRGEVVGHGRRTELAEQLRPRHGWLTRLREQTDGRPELLYLRERGCVAADMGHEARDVGVGGRQPEPVDQIT